MQSAQLILSWSMLTIIAVELIITFKKGLSGYLSVMGNGKFKYRFEKKRLPGFYYAVAAMALTTFTYGYVISAQLGLTAEFSVATTLFGSIGLIMAICYVPKTPPKSQ